jgi:hypothetical protein
VSGFTRIAMIDLLRQATPDPPVAMPIYYTNAVHVPKQSGVVAPRFDTPICAYRASLGRICWPGLIGLRDAFHAENQGNADLQAHEEPTAVQLLLGHSKLESTVRYLGIEVDDALEISEQTEI